MNIIKISYDHFNDIFTELRNGIYEVKDFGTLYFVNGKLHREDGPAIEYIFGTKCWLINDKYHRLDGPAVEHNNGEKSYYIEGKLYLKEEFEAAVYLYKNGLQDYL